MSEEFEPGQVIGDTYTIVRQLSEGGMGSVYEATHRRLRRKFAIKTLHRSVATSNEAYLRFRREAEIASELGHPNIIEVVDFDRAADGQAYMVMELLEGEDLDALLQRERTLPLDRVVALVKELASALGAAHARGVIHRDLKPQNIFLCRFGDRTDLPKILDFGISKIKGEQVALTANEAFLGTPSYMSPEQAQGRASAVDPRTDVFAMGAILYRCLTGELPFAGDSTMATLFAIAHHDPAPPCRINPALPDGVDRALLRALAKLPQDCHASVAALADDLAEAAELAHLAPTRPERAPLPAGGRSP